MVYVVPARVGVVGFTVKVWDPVFHVIQLGRVVAPDPSSNVKSELAEYEPAVVHEPPS